MGAVRRIGAATAIGLALTTAAAGQSSDFFAGPYIGLFWGTSSGEAAYTFNTIGYYNSNMGDTFSHGVSGHPIGGVLGYNWRSGPFVYGFEYSIYSAVLGISQYHVTSPYHPASDEFDLKGHWFVAITPRLGLAYNRFMAYVEAGPAAGHLVAEARNNVAGVHFWRPGTAIGVTVGAGADFAVTRFLSVGVNYQYLTLGPLSSVGESTIIGSEAPAGGGTETNHDIRYTSQTITGRVTFHFNPRDEAVARANGAPILKDWSGFYAGAFGGALHQAGGAVGYNFLFGDGHLAGVEAQASVDFCCGLDFEADVNGRIGTLLGENVLAYGEAGLGYLNGSFYGVLGGLFYTAGGGVELALTPRISSFMELKAVGAPGLGFIDTNFQSGINFHFN